MTLIQASICNNYNAVLLIGDRMVTVNYGEVEY